MKSLGWTSPLSPQRPPIPTRLHWAAGVCVSIAALIIVVGGVAERGIPHEVIEADVDRVIVALGAPARRLEPPPPPPPDAPEPPPEPVEPEVPTERAEEAPPPAPPEQPRRPIPNVSTEGQASSGVGEMREATPPPPPPPVELKQRFIEISARQYTRQVRYPYEALKRRHEGIGKLQVVVRRSGEVVRWSLVESTGSRYLDREIERVAKEVKRIDPLPDYFDRNTAALIIPFSFLIDS